MTASLVSSLGQLAKNAANADPAEALKGNARLLVDVLCQPRLLFVDAAIKAFLFGGLLCITRFNTSVLRSKKNELEAEIDRRHKNTDNYRAVVCLDDKFNFSSEGGMNTVLCDSSDAVGCLCTPLCSNSSSNGSFSSSHHIHGLVDSQFNADNSLQPTHVKTEYGCFMLTYLHALFCSYNIPVKSNLENPISYIRSVLRVYDKSSMASAKVSNNEETYESSDAKMVQEQLLFSPMAETFASLFTVKNSEKIVRHALDADKNYYQILDDFANTLKLMGNIYNLFVYYNKKPKKVKNHDRVLKEIVGLTKSLDTFFEIKSSYQQLKEKVLSLGDREDGGEKRGKANGNSSVKARRRENGDDSDEYDSGEDGSCDSASDDDDYGRGTFGLSRPNKRSSSSTEGTCCSSNAHYDFPTEYLIMEKNYGGNLKKLFDNYEILYNRACTASDDNDPGLRDSELTKAVVDILKHLGNGGACAAINTHQFLYQEKFVVGVKGKFTGSDQFTANKFVVASGTAARFSDYYRAPVAETKNLMNERNDLFDAPDGENGDEADADSTSTTGFQQLSALFSPDVAPRTEPKKKKRRLDLGGKKGKSENAEPLPTSSRSPLVDERKRRSPTPFSTKKRKVDEERTEDIRISRPTSPIPNTVDLIDEDCSPPNDVANDDDFQETPNVW